MLENSQLRCFIAVAEELHFGRAAQRLNMTQPPLSRQIQLLEHQVGAPLLLRTSRQVRLTPAGRALLPEARRIVSLAEEAASWARRIWSGEAGTVRIGFTAASGYSRIPRLLERARREMPGVDVVLREMVTHRQIEALETGLLDLGLVRALPPSSTLEARFLEREACLVALREDHPLARRPRLALSDLADIDLVGYSPDAARYLFDLSARLFDREGIRPRIVQQVGQIHTMLALTASGFGLALVPASAACLGMSGVAFRPLDCTPAEPIDLLAAWRAENDNPALGALKRVLPDP